MLTMKSIRNSIEIHLECQVIKEMKFKNCYDPLNRTHEEMHLPSVDLIYPISQFNVEQFEEQTEVKVKYI